MKIKAKAIMTPTQFYNKIKYIKKHKNSFRGEYNKEEGHSSMDD